MVNITCPNCGGPAVWNTPEEEAETGFIYMCMDCGWAISRQTFEAQYGKRESDESEIFL